MLNPNSGMCHLDMMKNMTKSDQSLTIYDADFGVNPGLAVYSCVHVGDVHVHGHVSVHISVHLCAGFLLSQLGASVL